MVPRGADRRKQQRKLDPGGSHGQDSADRVMPQMGVEKDAGDKTGRGRGEGRA